MTSSISIFFNSGRRVTSLAGRMRGSASEIGSKSQEDVADVGNG